MDPDYAQRTWQSYPIRIKPEAPLDADELMRRAAARRDRHPPRGDGDPPRGRLRGLRLELPHTEAAAREIVLLPLFPGLGDEAQDYVIERLLQLTPVEAL